jgi:hypothetical protein
MTEQPRISSSAFVSDKQVQQIVVQTPKGPTEIRNQPQ